MHNLVLCFPPSSGGWDVEVTTGRDEGALADQAWHMIPTLVQRGRQQPSYLLWLTDPTVRAVPSAECSTAHTCIWERVLTPVFYGILLFLAMV